MGSDSSFTQQPGSFGEEEGPEAEDDLPW